MKEFALRHPIVMFLIVDTIVYAVVSIAIALIGKKGA